MPIKEKYSDLDINFTQHPISMDVAKKYNVEAVKQSLKNLILLKRYEVPFHPEIYSGVPEMFFENADANTGAKLVRLVTDIINNYEPRVQLLEVNVLNQIDNNAIIINIVFNVINIPEEQRLDVALQRLR